MESCIYYIIIVTNLIKSVENIENSQKINKIMQRINSLTQQLTANTTSPEPVKVTITGGAGNIGYALSFMIGGGRLLGPDQPIDLTLLEIPQAEEALLGTVMELQDAAFPLLNSVRGSTDQADGFKGCHVSLANSSLDSAWDHCLTQNRSLCWLVPDQEDQVWSELTC